MLIYLTLLFAVLLLIFSVVHRADRNLEVACLISSAAFCGYFFLDRESPEYSIELVRQVTMLDGIWLYLLMLCRAPRLALWSAGLSFAGGIVLVILSPVEPLRLAAIGFFLLHLLLVFSLTLAPLVHYIQPQRHKA